MEYIRNFEEFINESKGDESWVIYTEDKTQYMGINILYVAKNLRAAKTVMTKMWNSGKYDTLSREILKDFEDLYGNLETFKIHSI